jgi:hypothetical protein
LKFPVLQRRMEDGKSRGDEVVQGRMVDAGCPRHGGGLCSSSRRMLRCFFTVCRRCHPVWGGGKEWAETQCWHRCYVGTVASGAVNSARVTHWCCNVAAVSGATLRRWKEAAVCLFSPVYTLLFFTLLTYSPTALFELPGKRGPTGGLERKKKEKSRGYRATRLSLFATLCELTLSELN